jgi:hypothetical protein
VKLEKAFQAIEVQPGEKLTPLHKKILRSMERREHYRKQRRKNKGRSK